MGKLKSEILKLKIRILPIAFKNISYIVSNLDI
jgi:hypothetical protein